MAAINISEGQDWREIQRSVENAWQGEIGLPINVSVESPGEHPRRFDSGVNRILDDERLWRVRLVVDERERVIEAESSNANRSGEARVRLSGISFERYGVVDTLCVGEKPIGELSRLIQVQLLIGVEAEIRRPIEPVRDGDRRGGEAEDREAAIDFVASRML